MNVLVNSSRCFCHSFTCVPQNSASRVKLAKSVTSRILALEQVLLAIYVVVLVSRSSLSALLIS
jgi:hypothetical protein